MRKITTGTLLFVLILCGCNQNSANKIENSMNSGVEKHRQELIEECRYELNKDNLTSMEDLEKLAAPLITTSTRIEVKKPSSPPENAQLLSHFGGQPYFEAGQTWPKTKAGKNLNFIFQIWNDGKIDLPADIKLVQFFYDWETLPWNTDNDGWLVKIYETITPEKQTTIDTPVTLVSAPYCEISFKSVLSLPNWWGIDRYSHKAYCLTWILNENDPLVNYEKVVEKLIGQQKYHQINEHSKLHGPEYPSQIGGYPTWVQSDDTPDRGNGEPMKLLFQIASEDNADIMWDDGGLIYVFYDRKNKRIEFKLQSH